MMGGPGRYVHFVLSIKLTDLFSSKSNAHPAGDDDGGGDGKGEGSETIITIDGNSKFRQVGYIEGDEEDDIPYWTSSGVFRSKIIIAGVPPSRCSTDGPRSTNKILVFDPTANPHSNKSPRAFLLITSTYAFAVKDEANKDGHALVMFSYCHFPPEESSISVSIMSQQCDSWKTMKSHKLPQLPPEFYSGQYTYWLFPSRRSASLPFYEQILQLYEVFFQCGWYVPR